MRRARPRDRRARSPTRWPQTPYDPTGYRDALADADAADGATGVHDRAAGVVPARPACCSGCSRRCTRSSPTRPTGRSRDLPLAERVARLRDPEVRAALLAEEPATATRSPRALMIALGPDLPARRPARLRAARRDERRRRRRARGPPPEEVVLDWLLERDGKALLFAPLASYVDGDHDAIREMMTPPAHRPRALRRRRALRPDLRRVSMPTYLLTHWVRDRTPRRAHPARAGGAPADAAHGRGVRLRRPRHARARASGPTSTSSTSTACACTRPRWSSTSRPAAAASCSASTATRRPSCAGEVTFDDGEPTGARPGRLVRAAGRAAAAL